MKELNLFIQLDNDIPAEAMLDARRAAFETAILKLWEGGHITHRQAAAQLGLSYYDYLDLLAARALPASNITEIRDDVIQEAVQKIKAAQQNA